MTELDVTATVLPLPPGFLESIGIDPPAPPPLPNMLFIGDYLGRVHTAMNRPWPSLKKLDRAYLGQTLIIAGGGPSLKDALPEIRRMHKKRGVKIIAPNGAHDYLVRHGIIPDFGVLIDWGSHVAGYIKRWQRDTKYIIGHQCAPETFKAMSHVRPYVVIVEGNFGEYEILREHYRGRDWVSIGGKNTIGMRCHELGAFMGFRRFEKFGFDSCEVNGKLYAYHKPYIETESMQDFTIALPNGTGARTFRANASMRKQASGFVAEMMELDALIRAKKMPPMEVIVHGDGAIPYLAAIMGAAGTCIVRHAEGNRLIEEAVA